MCAAESIFDDKMTKRAHHDDDAELLALSPKSARSSVGFGDIMGHMSPDASIGDFTALQRIILSANGNLQRLVSSYYNSPVRVVTRKCQEVEQTEGRSDFEREVELHVFGRVFAIAKSKVRLTRSELIRAVGERGVAIGQLFRQLNVMPTFELRDAGFLPPAALVDGAERAPLFFRQYELSSEGIACNIREEIRADLFELAPAVQLRASETGGSVTEVPNGRADGSAADEHDANEQGASSPPTLGDIMEPNRTFLQLPAGFSPLQRLMLTANGNVQRVLSSYFGRPLHLVVTLNQKREGPIYDRRAILLLGGRQLMVASTTVFLTDPAWAEAADRHAHELGALFHHFAELPTFTLHSTGRAPDYFWRQYRLRASGMTCEINETFPLNLFDEDETAGTELCGTEFGAM